MGCEEGQGNVIKVNVSFSNFIAVGITFKSWMYFDVCVCVCPCTFAKYQLVVEGIDVNKV